MKKLQKGDSAPPFSQKGIQEEHISLSQFANKKLLLSYYRYSECMLCNLRIHELMKYQQEWAQQGLEMVAVFQSPKEDVIASMQKHLPPFPVISDPERKLYALYGADRGNIAGWIQGVLKPGRVLKAASLGFPIIFGAGKQTLFPADFLIDEKGVLLEVFYSPDVSSHLPIERILGHLRFKN